MKPQGRRTEDVRVETQLDACYRDACLEGVDANIETKFIRSDNQANQGSTNKPS
ncbi:hypothetical protein O9993_10200 [Vibrio lentus]|nr:hypothetical protein [Vibrio lentus]